MNNDVLVFAVIFIIAITVICAGVVMAALNRVSGTANARRRRRKSGYRPPAHRAFKDVV
jgi:FlaG/FlaF family flagellin (archaellin)